MQIQKGKQFSLRWRFLALVILINGFGVELAWGQCANPAMTPCAASGLINVVTAGAQGLNAQGASGVITANSVTKELRATNTVGAWAQQGGTILFNPVTVIRTMSTTAATTNGQKGLLVTDAGSNVAADNISITLKTASGTLTGLRGVTVENGGLAVLTQAVVEVGGGGNGTLNYGLVSDGSGSKIDLGGRVDTSSRGAFAGLAQNGGEIVLRNGSQVMSAGARTVAAPIVASHALMATGAGSKISGTGSTVGTTGTLADAVRAEDSAQVSFTGSVLSVGMAGSGVGFDTHNAAAHALSGGQIALDSSTVSTTTQYSDGTAAYGAGSKISILNNTMVTVQNNRGSAAINVGDGATGIVDNSRLQVNGGFVASYTEGVGSTVTITDSIVDVQGVATSYAVRLLKGASGTMTRGSIRTNAPDTPGVFLGGDPLLPKTRLTLTDVVVDTLGPSNSMGAISDTNSELLVIRGTVSTAGSPARVSTFANGLAARNPGGKLVSEETTVHTTGLKGFGVAADDGGKIELTRNVVRTEGELAVGLLTTVEMPGMDRIADIKATDIQVSTTGLRGYGASAEQSFLDAPSTITLNGASSITTNGDQATGFRAVNGGTAIADGTAVITTNGTDAYGTLARNSAGPKISTVTLSNAQVKTHGSNAHGAVVQNGGQTTGSNATAVIASGGSAMALYSFAEPGFISKAAFTNSSLTNSNGPTIGVAGESLINLTDATVGGSGQWLHVGADTDFPGLLPATAAAAPTVATINADASTMSGFASTASGSVSNVSMTASALWNMTGDSNLTKLINSASKVAYATPTGSPTQLSNYLKLTTNNYTGAGGTLAMNTYLNDDSAPSDRLIIDQGSATGTTLLNISNITGPGALTVGNGILVIEAINGATTMAGAFALAVSPLVAGNYEYTLHRGSVDASGPENWYLRSSLRATPSAAPIPVSGKEMLMLLVMLLLATAIFGRTGGIKRRGSC